MTRDATRDVTRARFRVRIRVRVFYQVFEAFEGPVTEPQQTFVTDLVTDPLARCTPLVTHPRYTPSLHTSDEQAGPVTALFAASWLVLNSCNEEVALRFALPCCRVT